MKYRSKGEWIVKSTAQEKRGVSPASLNLKQFYQSKISKSVHYINFVCLFASLFMESGFKN